MKNVRILGRNFRDGFKNVFRNFSLSFASISCITITLLVVAVALIGSLNVENFTKLISDDFTIVAFVKNDASTEDEEKIEAKLNKIGNIESITFVSKADTKKEMMESSETFRSIMSAWEEEENPLSDAYQIKVKDIEKIEKTAEKIKKKTRNCIPRL